MRVVVVAIALLDIGVLAVSLVSKLRGRAAFRAFVNGLAGLRVIPARRAAPVAAASIAFEALVLLVLLSPAGPAVGLLVAGALFGGFAAVLAVAVRRGAAVGCHCFGTTDVPVAVRHVARSGLLAALSFGACGYALAAPTLSLAGLGPPQTLAALTVASMAVVATVRLDDLVWLFRGTARQAPRSQ